MIKKNHTTRPPIIVVAGHIDHGKTTLLNKIKNIKTAQKEFGGITQHINAYNVETKYGNMTFIDTPGHSAFNSIRSKSIKCSDIMLLVLALDDGIQTQTIESINIAQKNNIPIIVCLNKIDKIEILNKKEKIINELSKFNLIQESWGGYTFFINVSAKTGEGLSDLIDAIHIQADMLDLKINNDYLASGIILDNKIDDKIGNITSLIIKNGKLKKGDIIRTNNEQNKIKLIIENGKFVQESTPSNYVDIIGLSNNQEIGSEFTCVNKNTQKIKKIKNPILIENTVYTTKDLIQKMSLKNEKKINFIIKTDVHGSIDVLKDAIEKISTDKFKLNIVKIDIGNLSKSDVELAIITKSIIICFNTKVTQQINKLAKNNDIKITIYNVIYDIITYITDLIQTKIAQDQKEDIIGVAEVKKIFIQENKTIIAGCLITQGKIKQNSQVKVFRKNNLIHKGHIDSIKIFKNYTHEVTAGTECGISIKNYNNLQINDKIKAYLQECT